MHEDLTYSSNGVCFLASDFLPALIKVKPGFIF